MDVEVMVWLENSLKSKSWSLSLVVRQDSLETYENYFKVMFTISLIVFLEIIKISGIPWEREGEIWSS